MEELYNRGEKEFLDSKPTIKFIRRINDLVDALNSNTEKYGLHADPSSQSNKVNMRTQGSYKNIT